MLNKSQVDVRDVARAHILALTKPAASGKRIILVFGLVAPELVANIIREQFPRMKRRILEGNPSRSCREVCSLRAGTRVEASRFLVKGGIISGRRRV